MQRWLRVFSAASTEPNVAALENELRRRWPGLTLAVVGDDQGWYECSVLIAEKPSGCVLQRYLREEEQVKGELSAWAAWVEEQPPGPNNELVMARLATAQQVFTLTMGSDVQLARAAAQWLATATDGIWHEDADGFFAADGTMLLRDE